MNILDTKAGAAAVYLLGAGIAALLVYKFVWPSLKEKLNPASDKNVAYTGVNAVGAALTGDKDFSLGSWIYDLTHEEYDPNSGLQTGAKTLRDGAKATDALWGPIGNISLRAQ